MIGRSNIAKSKSRPPDTYRPIWQTEPISFAEGSFGLRIIINPGIDYLEDPSTTFISFTSLRMRGGHILTLCRNLLIQHLTACREIIAQTRISQL